MSFFEILLITLLTTLLGFLYCQHTYWQRRGIPQTKTNFLFGNFFKIKTCHISELTQEVYDAFKGKAKVAGTYIFSKPVAVVLDLDLVKNILIKDFDAFVDRSEYRNEEGDPMASHLFLLTGERWRSMRAKLTPAFTSGKMRFMFPTIARIAKEFEAAFQAHLENTKDGAVELHNLMSCYTTDVIGTCVFGVDCNSLKNPDGEFRQIGRRVVNRNHVAVRWHLLRDTYLNFFKYFGVKFSDRLARKFIFNMISRTVAAREKQGIKRNDFLDLMIGLRNTKDAKGQALLSLQDMAAQSLLFFVAGFESSSSNMTYSLYELSKNPGIQERVRKEIVSVLKKHDNVLTYEAMTEMTYLDQIITEAVRKYPGLSSLTRIAAKDYKVPDTDVVIEKGTCVYIPVRAIHHDPEIYKDPEEYRPERFDPSEVKKRHPQSFLAFGDGPRNCIGLRFGRMQTRIGLITLLQSFKFSASPKTPDYLEITKRSFILVPAHGVWVKAEKLEES